MGRTSFRIVLVVAVIVALQAPAADGAEEAAENESLCGPNVFPVSVLLERAAKSPLGPGDARLLRAVADLVDKEEQIADPKAAPAEQRARLAIRLDFVPAANAARALEKFLDSAVFVYEPASNYLLVSAPPRMVNAVTKLIEELDTPPATVAIHICIAELRLAREAEIDGGSSDASATAPSIENDGAAWLAWARQQGRLVVLSQPRLITIDHQPASVRIGQIVPTGMANPDTDDPAEGEGSQRMEVGLNLGVTPRIAPEGVIIMELDVEHSRVVNPDETAAPRIGRMAVRTTVSANDGQTVIVSGLIQRTEDGDRQAIIAVTPQVNPEKR